MSELNLLELEHGLKAIDPKRYSVQARADEVQFAPMSDVSGGGGVFWITMGAILDEEPSWNAVFPNLRDRYLLDFSRRETMLASAIYSMKTRIGTLDYALNGPPRAKKFAQELLDHPGFADNFREVVQKVSGDLDTSDNGAFIELLRAGNPLTDAKERPVLGFAHLDSRQCWRSFDPEYPVWYTNPVSGLIRKLHRSRVVIAADNPQSVELARGIGLCATSRVLKMTRVFRNMQTYMDEKISGRFTRAIGAISGINAKQLRDALQQNARDADSKGFVIYKDIPFLINPNTEPGNDVKIMLQDLASLPDGFSFQDDADLYAYILAFAFGVDAREFWPATQSGATKADASVQNMKAQGRGIGNRIQTMTTMIRACLPETVEFEFDFTDDAQDLLHAQINQVRVGYYDMNIKNGTISAQESRALQIAEGVLDETVMNTMEAPATGDTNVNTPQTVTPAPDQTAQPNPSDNGATPITPVVTKSVTMYRKSVRDAVRGLWGGSLTLIDFYESMSAAIRRQFPLAWNEGAAQFGIGAEERSAEEEQRLTLEINTETTYITAFGHAILADSKANGGALQPLLDRADLWVNAYNRIVNLAGVMAAADQKGEWVYGDTIDHCASCSGYEGRVYRNSIWRKYLEPLDLMPKGHGLSCKGYRCDCTIVPTTKPITRGRPPIIQKALETPIHSHSAFEAA